MMTRKFISLFPLILIPLSLCFIPRLTQAQGSKEIPREWIDPDTGHRVMRLSDEPGSASLYFHQNPYTPDGQKLIITTPTGLSAINLKTRAIEKIVEGRVGVIIVGRKTGQVYYIKSVRTNNSLTATVYATDLNTKATREIAKLPPGASVSAVNADETLLAGIIDDKNAAAIKEGRPPGPPPASRGDAYPGKGEMMENRLAERRPLQLITVNTKTGEVKTLLRGTDWYNHIQFSPTDPTLLMFCHELVPDRTDGQLANSKELIRPAVFKAEKLVNLSKHNYSLEPNVTFTPDMKWIVFRSNMFGPTHVFAVEIEKAN